MKVSVDPGKCEGHNRCLMFDTDMFEADDLGYVTARGDGTVPPGQEDEVRLAALNCPEHAIDLEENT